MRIGERRLPYRKRPVRRTAKEIECGRFRARSRTETRAPEDYLVLACANIETVETIEDDFSFAHKNCSTSTHIDDARFAPLVKASGPQIMKRRELDVFARTNSAHDQTVEIR